MSRFVHTFDKRRVQMRSISFVRGSGSRRALALAVLATAVHSQMCSVSQAVVLALTGDDTQTTPEVGLGRTIAEALQATLNDPFAYNPASPTSPLPFQIINSNNDALKGYNGFGPAEFPIVVAYTFRG